MILSHRVAPRKPKGFHVTEALNATLFLSDIHGLEGTQHWLIVEVPFYGLSQVKNSSIFHLLLNQHIQAHVHASCFINNVNVMYLLLNQHVRIVQPKLIVNPLSVVPE